MYPYLKGTVMFKLNINELRFALKNAVHVKKHQVFSAVRIVVEGNDCTVIGSDGTTFSLFDVTCDGDGNAYDYVIKIDTLLDFIGKEKKADVEFLDASFGAVVKVNGVSKNVGTIKGWDFPDPPTFDENTIVQNHYNPQQFHDGIEYCKLATNCRKDNWRLAFTLIQAVGNHFFATDSFRVHRYRFNNYGKNEILIPPAVWKRHKIFNDKNTEIHLLQDERFVGIDQGMTRIITKREDLKFPNVENMFPHEDPRVKHSWLQLRVDDVNMLLMRCHKQFAYKDGAFFGIGKEVDWSATVECINKVGEVNSFVLDRGYAVDALKGFESLLLSCDGGNKPVTFYEGNGSRGAIVMPVRSDKKLVAPKSAEVVEEVKPEPEPEKVEEPIPAEPEPEPVEEPKEIGFDELPEEVKAEIIALNEDYENKVTILQNAFDKMTLKFRYAVDLGAMPHEELPEVCDHHEGLDCCLNGTWVWVWGDTKPIANELKKNGFFWHNKRQMWYWNESFPQFVKEAFAA